MSKVLKFSLPENSGQTNINEAETEIKQVEGVKFTTTSEVRSGEVQAALMIVQVLPTVLDAAEKAWPMLQKIGGVFRQKGMKGVTIEGPGGLKISLDKASQEDVQKLIDAMSQRK